jgi:ComF family protein
VDNTALIKTDERPRSFLGRTADDLLDFFFPIYCLGCRTVMSASSPTPYLCPHCLEKIRLTSQLQCLFCSSLNPTGQTCAACRRIYHLDYLWPAAHYNDPLLKKALWAYKYKFVHSLHLALGALLIRFLESKHKNNFLKTYREQIVIIPVPLHARRFRWRSYNQSALLAEELSRSFSLAMAPPILTRSKKRRPQTEINDPEERRSNIAGIFACSQTEALRGKTILLIDDVCTTGSTLNACAEVLKQAGAEKVIGLVVAKG